MTVALERSMKTLAKIHVGRSPSSEPDRVAGGAAKITAETRWKFKSPTLRSGRGRDSSVICRDSPGGLSGERIRRRVKEIRSRSFASGGIGRRAAGHGHAEFAQSHHHN
jgi:hypothetical protein